MSLSLDEIKKSDNVAELLSDSELSLIGSNVLRGYEIDEESRSSWKSVVDKAMAIAKQEMKEKDFPWPNASNVKMPFITRACIDFAARTLPEIIPNNDIVKGVMVGKDDAKGTKQKRCDRIAKFMSYQLMERFPEWESGTDSLLQTIPVVGTVFKKTYYSESEKRCISEMCVPYDIVVNYDTQSLETARRITHILYMYSNDILERQRRGIYLEDIKLSELCPSENANSSDEDSTITILEQHCYLDLDEDDYKEPYIVTVHKETEKVLRIIPRFKSIEKKKDKIIKIEAEQYFTDFHFIRSPDGGFYSIGFGSLLLAINSAINTIVNQLIDSGTLANMQGGLLSKELRLKGGEFNITMGEWKVLETVSGTKLADAVYQFPVKEPSSTLLELLKLLIEEAKDLTSSTDATMGKQPAQNVAGTAISQLIEQGSKVFVAISKRIYRGFKKEYQKIYDLNYNYLSQKEYIEMLDDPDANVKKDFDPKTCDIYPIADPSLSSDSSRVARMTVIGQLSTIDKRAADSMVLDIMHIDDAQKKKLQPPVNPNAPPPPEQQKILADIGLIKAQISNMAQLAAQETAKVQAHQAKTQAEIPVLDAQVHESMARVWKMQQDALHNHTKDNITTNKSLNDLKIKKANIMLDQQNQQQQMGLEAAKLHSRNAIDSSKLEIEGQKVTIDAALTNKKLNIEAKENKNGSNE